MNKRCKKKSLKLELIYCNSRNIDKKDYKLNKEKAQKINQNGCHYKKFIKYWAIYPPYF